MRRLTMYSLIGLCLLSGGIILKQPEKKVQSVLDQPPAITNSDLPTPTPIVAIEDLKRVKKADTLYVRDSHLSIGESKYSMIKKLGVPGRIVDTEYDFEYYIYNNDYNKLLFVAIKKSKIVGFYTNSFNFEYLGITPGNTVEEINEVLDQDFKLSQVLDYTEEDLEIKLLMDTLETKKVTGVYIISNRVKRKEYTEEIMLNIALMTYDLTNSVRAKHSLPALSWSSSAAKAARKHTKDMAVNSYFDHISLLGDSPGDRLYAEGISYTKVGENIIAGYDSVIISNHAWYNSQKHRKNMLSETYRYLGVGFYYRKSSDYKTYLSQTFYR